MEDGNIQQPGETVTPSQSPAPEPPAPVSTPPASESPIAEKPEHPSDGGPKFDTSKADLPAAAISANGSVITWTASEFIAHAKSFGWYAALFLAAAGFAALVFLITRDPVSVGVILFGAIMFGIYAGHKPRELEYRVDTRGLTIGSKHFTYDHFRSFSVLPEGAFSSIVFMPLKRFAVPTTIYYAPEDEDKIVGLLGDCLPFEQRGHDAVDRLMHRIHF